MRFTPTSRNRSISPFVYVAAFVAAALTLTPDLSAQRQARAVSALAPANFNYKTDSMGYRWDINQSGMVNDGTSDCFDGGFMLQVKGQQFNASRPMMSADGTEFVLSAPMHGLNVTRRVRLDAKNAFVRYVDTLHNPTNSSISVPINILTYFGSNPQTVVSDKIKPVSGVLPKGESAIVAFQSAGSSRPSVLMHLGDPRGKHKPRVLVTNGNRQLQFTWTLTIKPGQSQSLMYAVGQRRLQAMPDAKSLKAQFKPVLARAFIKDLPSKLRRTVLNWRGGYGDDGPLRFNIEAALGVPPDVVDVLALGESTRLRGTAACEHLAVETRYGEKVIEFAKVAAMVGGKRPGSRQRLILRDGQVLVGPIQTRGLRFVMNTGLSIELTAASVDRLVLRKSPADGKPDPTANAYVETHHGDRLAVAVDPTLKFDTVTPWGVLHVAVDDVAYLRPPENGTPGLQVRLKDGSRFFAYLGGAKVRVKSLLFGPQTLDTSEVRGMTAATGVSDDDDDRGVAEAHVILTGGQVLVGRLDLPAIHFLALGEVIPIAPSQARVMRNQSEETDEEGTPVAAPFEAELWGGGRVVGLLRESSVPVRVGADVCHVPVHDLLEAHAPTPTVPDAVRTRIAALVRDLGHPEWSRRESATKELAAIGYLARGMLNETMSQTQDPEVKRRAEALLTQIDETNP